MRLRPIRFSDAQHWSRLRRDNQSHLEPWEPSVSSHWPERHRTFAWFSLWRQLRSQTRKGNVYPFAIELNREYSGQLTIGGIQRGALQSGWLGYWVASAQCGGGVATAAAALALDWCFGPLGLHRMEATVREENLPSKAVLAKLGFREEGIIRDYLQVLGVWHDHILLGLTAPESNSGVLARLEREGKVFGAASSPSPPTTLL